MSENIKKISIVPFTLSFGAIGISVFLGSWAWLGNAPLHTVMEVVATTLALFVSLIAFLRYYSQKDIIYLFIGTGFFGTALLDSYHSIVTSTFFALYFPTNLSSLAPWSWTAPRLFLSVLMVASWLVWQRQIEQSIIHDKIVYFFSGLLTLGIFLFFIFVPHPDAYYLDFFITRPSDLVPGLFFLVALIGYYKKGVWRFDPFEYWLIVFLILSVGIHLIIMPFSEQIFDARFDIAHILKMVSYLCILTGLSVSVFQVFQQSAENAQFLETMNASMRKEIEERKSAQKQLADSLDFQKTISEELNAVINTAVDGVILIDEKGIVETFNPAAARLFGYSPDEVIGQNVKMLMPKFYAKDHDQFLANYKETRKAKVIGIGREVTGLKKNGDEFPMELSVGETRIDTALRYVGIIHDISERKIADDKLKKNVAELERSNKELEQFAYVASHDLQEPLRMVSSYCDLLQRRYGDQLDQDAKDFIGFATDGAKRMQNLVSDLLKFSRAGWDNIKFEDIDLNEMMLEIHHTLEKRISESQAMLTFDKLPIVHASISQVTQIFQNLVQNAIKFRGDDPPVISIAAKKQKGMWKFTIQDNGIGIDEKFYDRVFLVFQRLHTRDEYDGTGIGLAITKRMIERHGGEIWIEKNKNGVGTTFAFTLPIIKTGKAKS